MKYKKKIIKKLIKNREILKCDGFLIFKKNKKKIFLNIINKDKTIAKNCVNGLKCLSELFKKNKIFLFLTLFNIYLIKKKKILINLKNKNNLFLYIKYKKKNKKNIIFINKLGNIHLLIEKNIKNKKYIKKTNLNISYYKIKKNKIKIKTYEKGVGETSSCGSANCSLIFNLIKNNITKINIKTEIKQKKGLIRLSIFSKNNKLIVKNKIKENKNFEGFLKK